MSDRVVFVGPSLTAADRAGYPALRFRPPVADGDLFALSDSGVRVVGIVDGAFGDRPAIGHKEILWLMARGVTVIGGASMGALRAAELDVYGMQGVGEIYRGFRTGLLSDDSDVAVGHGPGYLGHRAVTVAMVDVQATLAALVARGRLSDPESRRIRDAARAIHFAKRTWAALADAAAPADTGALLRLLRSGHVERKRIDALDVLRRISETAPAERMPAPFEPPATRTFRRQMARAFKD